MKRCLSSILIGLGVPLFAQTPPPSPQGPLNSAQSVTPETPQASLLSTRSTLVLAPALVRNKAGDLVFTLAANDFVLTDDGIPQKLTLEQDTGGEPLALVVVIEIGGAGAREFNKFSSIAPPLALAKMAAIAATDGLKRNVPETVAHLTGGEYFKLTDAKTLERSLATISNHIPNRYVLSFQPQSPHPGLHVINLSLPNYAKLAVTARTSYWVDLEATSSNPLTNPH
jgi:hypothetical protein